MDYKEMFPDYETIKPGEWSNHNQTITCIDGNGERTSVEIGLYREPNDGGEYANTLTLQIFDGDNVLLSYQVANAVQITSCTELYEAVMYEYRKYDTELNSLFFDLDVRMKKSDILLTYAALQHDINGDEVARYEDGVKQEENGLLDALIPSGEPEFDEIYEGNCKDYLENLNGQDRFRRYDGDCRLEFIF